VAEKNPVKISFFLPYLWENESKVGTLIEIDESASSYQEQIKIHYGVKPKKEDIVLGAKPYIFLELLEHLKKVVGKTPEEMEYPYENIFLDRIITHLWEGTAKIFTDSQSIVSRPNLN